MKSAVASILPDLPAWQLSDLAGRLVELSGQQSTAHLTAAFGLVLEAQLCGDRAAWVTFEQSAFFPPDVAAGGVDVESLPVVRIATALAAGRAAEHLVRSGGFGLVVIDLSSAAGDAYAHDASSSPSRAAADAAPRIGAHASGRRADPHQEIARHVVDQFTDFAAGRSAVVGAERRPGRYDVRVRVIKDKRRAPGWDHVEACRGSVGMR